MSINDAQGRSIGMMIDQMQIAVIQDDVDALKRTLAVRAEIERSIPSTAWLFAAN
jgi:hypothetical protein